jgi:serine O-acetyltransferase
VPDLTCRQLMRADVDRYSHMLVRDGTARLPRETKGLADLRAVLMCQGLQAGLVHRVGHALLVWTPATVVGRVVRVAGRLAHFVANRVVETVTGIQIAEHATIGPGLYIGHFGGVVVGAVTVGDNCTLSHGVTLGRSARAGQDARPTLGDRVWIGPGAVVTGGVHLGDDCVVGANTVLTRDLPDRHCALGAPAVIRPGRGSFEMVVYPGMETDERRSSSLELVDVTARPADRVVAGSV